MESTFLNEELEVVAGTGTVSKSGFHIHIVVADKDGVTTGGHLKNGCIVRTTVELVILKFDDQEYKREPDKSTGYDELVIK